jgi:lysozyme
MAVNRQHVTGGAVGFAGAIAIATPLIIQWEGFASVARHDPIDPPGIYTVCNGITNYDLPGLKPGMRFDKEHCAKLLRDHLPRYTAAIDKCVTAKISDNPRAALYSAAYNLGAGTVCKSSIVRKINAGDLKGGCDALLLYVNSKGEFRQGLLNRRRVERRLCLTPGPLPSPQRDELAGVKPAVQVDSQRPAPAAGWFGFLKRIFA